MTNPSKKPRTNIPHHLILKEILPRFPAKSLCRSKTVAREWKSVIESVKLTSRSILTVKDEDFAIEAVEVYEDIILNSNTFVVNIDTPRYLLSSCNGLAFMISAPDESDEDGLQLLDHLHLFDFFYVVCNPVLGADHFVEIPHPEEYLLADGNVWGDNYNFGFGYVSSRDDYYIVAIDVSKNSKIGLYTYSLRSQQWKNKMVTIGDEKGEGKALPLKLQEHWFVRIGVLVNEALHWGITQGKDNHFIFAYDLVSLEDTRLIDLPYRGFGDATLTPFPAFTLSSLDDCLCVWPYYGKQDHVYEVWLMKEYGVVESWTKVFRFQMNGALCCRQIFGYIKPKMVMLFTNADELIVADLSCDPPKFSNAVLEARIEEVSYFPSLVSVFALISELRE